MARPAKVIGGLVAVGGSVLMAWLAVEDIASAWLTLVAFGVAAIAGIAFLAYDVRRDPMAAVRQASTGLVVEEAPISAPSEAA